MKSTLVSVSSIVLAFGLAACSDNNSSEVESVSPPPIPADDVDLIDNLVPHHQMAIQMADVEVSNGTRQDVKEMAQMMKIAQQEEIVKMQNIRAELVGSDRIAAMRDPHGEQDLAELQAATGADVDRLFLENMIPHHAGAVSLAHRAFDNLTNPELRNMAHMAVVAQTREMNEMLDKLGE
jgi:uncharacterized protein (DUF305 family)